MAGIAPCGSTPLKSEILAAVEGEVSVDAPAQWVYPDLHVESDYAFHGMTPKSANATTHWVEDPQYTTQVNYQCATPCLLESRPPIGPEVDIAPGAGPAADVQDSGAVEPG